MPDAPRPLSGQPPSGHPLSGLAAIEALHRAPQDQVLAGLIPAATLGPAARERVRGTAAALLVELRAGQAESWTARFLQEYRLNTQEGVALLGLAEAFLRIPDAETADLFIRDKVGTADWAAHLGQSDSLLVNSATWALVATRAVVGDSPDGQVLRQVMARLGEPVVRTAVGRAIRMMGQVFVMGETIGAALARMRQPEHRGFVASFDMLGEAAVTSADADRYFAAYEGAIASLAGTPAGPAGAHSISVKLSALYPRYEPAQAARAVPALAERLRALARAAAAAGIGLTVDAEESQRLMPSLDIIAAAASDPALSGWEGLGMAVQAYDRRARAVVAWADETAAAAHRRLAVRLVKGAYWDGEIKRTQEAGLADYAVFTRKAATDVSYLACARDMLAARHLFPAFASHNALTVATLLEWAGARRDFEFQRLQGMGAGLYEKLVREQGYRCRIYAPVGGHRDLLAYLVRRLLENGANSSFVHQLADPNLSEAQILADPAAKLDSPPDVPIRLPKDLFAPERANSAGIDLQDRAVVARLSQELARHWTGRHQAAPLVGGHTLAGPAQPVCDPADRGRQVGTVVAARPADVAEALRQATAAAPGWSAWAVEDRAACLERLADLLEAHRTELMALLVREAGKLIPDALSEVREAADFCRYYAMNARREFAPLALPGPTGERNELRLYGRGVFACIAPWNFPLAIFLGQVAAALAAGNAVVAKPAPQTPLIGCRAIALALEAGVPPSVLHCLPGGAEVGRALVADPRVAGVAFTGSVAAARAIARSLLEDQRRPLVPLIAETGGLNAMIVDSTALPEQVVGDVITSAFRSAGQRCSALRLLLLQEETAERTLEMLAGAMALLHVGDPGDIATDVGPVIDEAARQRLESYRQEQRARWIATTPAPDGPGLFVPPTAIRLDRPEDLTEEWFGPLLHVATWKAGSLEATVERINATGFGLTMGLHSRIAATADRVAALARVGNLYVNRSMIGAVVGSQPFGGEGLSGTGPKAGGPHYLSRFATERTLSVDTTSAGGNAALLSSAG